MSSTGNKDESNISLHKNYFKKINVDESKQVKNKNLNLNLFDFTPLIQISSETIIEKIKKGDIKDILYTTDIRKELPVFISESGINSLKPLTMIELFESVVKEMGKEDALFVEKEGKFISLTWYQYHKQVIYLAKALLSLGVEAYRTVNILGHNSPEWFISFLGGMFACVPPVGIYPTNHSEACMYIAEDSQCGCLILDSLSNYRKYERELKRLKHLKAIVFYCDLSDAEMKSLVNPFVPIYLWKDFLTLGKRSLLDFELSSRVNMQKPGNCCNLIYTSGTTGAPKGVMLSHDNLTWTARALAINYSQIIGHKQKLVSFLPLSHIAGQVVDILLTMVTRSQVYFAKPDALSGSLVETLRTVNPTVFFAVPRIFEKFEEKIKEAINSSSLIKRKIIKWAMKIGQKTVERRFKGQSAPLSYGIANYLVFSRIRAALGFSHTKVVAFGAAPMKKTTIDFFKSLNIPLFNNYGMSETTGPQFMNLSDTNVDLYSAGTTLYGTDVKINQPDRDGVGEIFFRGRNRFMGYYNNEAATKEAIDKDGFIHSGDLGYINSKGNLVITGRLKELIVTAGGENVAPLPIEETLKEMCKLISHVFVHGDNRPYLIALITLKSDIQGNLVDDIVDIIKNLDTVGDISTVIDAINDEKVKSYIQTAIDKVNSRAVSRAQIIRRWSFLPQDFTIENGELTPTHKLKRNFISQKYDKIIGKLYSTPKF